MSELSELIEINKNIEKQNDEIIRLLKKIAGEEELVVEEESVVEEMNDEPLEESPQIIPKNIFKNDLDVGEVFFIEEQDIFKLSISDNETNIDNLTGSSKACNFDQQEMVANESVKLNQAIQPSTVILNKEQSTNLPEVLKICYDGNAENVFIPMSAMTQLLGAPRELMEVMNIDFYKTDNQLIEKIFPEGE